MTKRLRNLSDNVGNVDITSVHKVYIPDVRVKYGAYSCEVECVDNNNFVEDVDERDELTSVDDFDDANNYDVDLEDIEYNLMENEPSDDDQYETPTFNNDGFDDSVLFSSGLLIYI